LTVDGIRFIILVILSGRRENEGCPGMEEQDLLEKRIRTNILYDHYKELLTRKQRRVYELREFADLSLAEIAERFDTTRQAVHDLLVRTRGRLESFEAKTKLAERISALESDVRDLRAKLQLVESRRGRGPMPGLEGVRREREPI
jgi:predicted DNA-binding protein YlxM (UPF0122 family)